MSEDRKVVPLDLLDLMEPDVLKKLQKRFSDLFGFNVAFTGPNCRQVGEEDRQYLVGTTCEKIKNREKIPTDICHESDVEAGKIAKEKGLPILYRCHCYCSNFVIPIKVLEDVIGFIFSGQFFAQEPGQKSDEQWNRLLFGIPEPDWEKEKKKIQKEEKSEFDRLLIEGGFINLPDDEKYIRQDFFQKPQYKPGREELLRVARRAHLPYGEQEEFITSFEQKYDPDIRGNRVKEAIDIVKYIKTLSEVANTISNEWTIKYAMKEYINVCEEAKKTTKRRLLRNRNIQKEINCHLEELSGKIKPFIDRSYDSSDKRMKWAEEIDTIAGNIYEELLGLEAKWALSDARAINFLCWRKVTAKQLIKDTLSLHNTARDPSHKQRTQNELLKRKLATLRNESTNIRKKANPEIAISIWGTLTGAIGLVFGLFLGPLVGIAVWAFFVIILVIITLLYVRNWGE